MGGFEGEREEVIVREVGGWTCSLTGGVRGGVEERGAVGRGEVGGAVAGGAGVA